MSVGDCNSSECRPTDCEGLTWNEWHFFVIALKQTLKIHFQMGRLAGNWYGRNSLKWPEHVQANAFDSVQLIKKTKLLSCSKKKPICHYLGFHELGPRLQSTLSPHLTGPEAARKYSRWRTHGKYILYHHYIYIYIYIFSLAALRMNHFEG